LRPGPATKCEAPVKAIARRLDRLEDQVGPADGNGHGPASNATAPDNEIRIRVCYVERHWKPESAGAAARDR